MTSIEPESPPVDSVTVYVDWSALASAPTQHVNQFVAQVGPPTQDGTPDGIYLGIAHLAPPMIVSSDPDRRQREIEVAARGLAPEVLGRFHMSRERCSELIRVLQETLENYDAAATRHQQLKAKRQGP